MKFYLFLKSLLLTTSFPVRHLLFIATATAIACLAFTLIYLILLAGALLGHGHLGNPLSYPIGLAALMALGIVAGGGLCLPSCALGYWTCRRLQWPPLAAFPLTLVTGALEVTVLGTFIRTGSPELDAFSPGHAFVTFFFMLATPLGVYWWTTESPRAPFDGLRRLLLRKYFGEPPADPAE